MLGLTVYVYGKLDLNSDSAISLCDLETMSFRVSFSVERNKVKTTTVMRALSNECA